MKGDAAQGSSKRNLPSDVKVGWNSDIRMRPLVTIFIARCLSNICRLILIAMTAVSTSLYGSHSGSQPGPGWQSMDTHSSSAVTTGGVGTLVKRHACFPSWTTYVVCFRRGASFFQVWGWRRGYTSASSEWMRCGVLVSFSTIPLRSSNSRDASHLPKILFSVMLL